MKRIFEFELQIVKAAGQPTEIGKARNESRQSIRQLKFTTRVAFQRSPL